MGSVALYLLEDLFRKKCFQTPNAAVGLVCLSASSAMDWLAEQVKAAF